MVRSFRVRLAVAVTLALLPLLLLLAHNRSLATEYGQDGSTICVVVHKPSEYDKYATAGYRPMFGQRPTWRGGDAGFCN